MLPENEEAFELWLAVSTQWRTTAMGIIGLDYQALYLEADRLEIDLSPCMMDKIKALERLEIDRSNDKRS